MDGKNFLEFLVDIWISQINAES